MIPTDGTDIPGPVDWHNASHWIAYDHSAKTVETWCKSGPDYRYIMKTRIRPMSPMEILLSDLRDSSKEEVQAALAQKGWL